ncbi:hypothetical protein R3W88_018854 [Solanum pinnatisectum]|uniref:Defensin-like protein n=1 Tax=Solanum pinnatisectum TaxID=50273 RepID=A0AAV9KLL1_9SOLN|nr:hypothetical protein R3W88_018854 [Solanum pinnatisectum]
MKYFLSITFSLFVLYSTKMNGLMGYCHVYIPSPTQPCDALKCNDLCISKYGHSPPPPGIKGPIQIGECDPDETCDCIFCCEAQCLYK